MSEDRRSIAVRASAGAGSTPTRSGGRGTRSTTPALLLDLDVAKRNIAIMAERFRELPAELRPHIKVHKSPELALLEREAGAIGVACATVWEAQVMAEAGIEDVLVANQVVHPDKVAALARRSPRRHRITVAVDDAANVDALDRRPRRPASRLEVLIELDVGMGRCGVRTKEEALPLAEHIAGSRRLACAGMQGYEGHCMLEPDREVRSAEAQAANDEADRGRRPPRRARLRVGGRLGRRHRHLLHHRRQPAHHRGTGGLLHADGLLPRQPRPRRVRGRADRARQPSSAGRATRSSSTAGRKSVGIDFVLPPMVAHPEGEIRYYAEEHALFDFPGPPPVDLGDRVEIWPGTAPRRSTCTTSSTSSRTESSPTSGPSPARPGPSTGVVSEGASTEAPAAARAVSPADAFRSWLAADGPIVGVGMKMFLDHHGPLAYLDALRGHDDLWRRVRPFVLPSFTELEAAARTLAGGDILYGAQDCHWEQSGAFTGAVSPRSLLELGCTFAETGHAERLRWFGESWETTCRKVGAAARAGLVPLVCVGEAGTDGGGAGRPRRSSAGSPPPSRPRATRRCSSPTSRAGRSERPRRPASITSPRSSGGCAVCSPTIRPTPPCCTAAASRPGRSASSWRDAGRRRLHRPRGDDGGRARRDRPPHARAARPSVRKLVNDAFAVVDEMVDGLEIAFPTQIELTPSRRGIVSTRRAESRRVGIVVGGGSGHEPAFVGYLGPRSRRRRRPRERLRLPLGHMFKTPEESDAARRHFQAHGLNVNMSARIGDHIEYYYVDSEPLLSNSPSNPAAATRSTSSSPSNVYP